MVGFLRVLSSEIYKTKRNWNFTIILLLPVVVTTIMFGFIIKEFSGNSAPQGYNYWNMYCGKIFQFYYLLYPLLTAVIAFSMSNIEHRNHGFKQIYTFPTSKLNLYFSKVSILIFWISSSLILAFVLIIISGNLLSLMFPQLGFQNYNIINAIVVFFIRTFITLIALISIHFFLSVYWDNFIISVGFACFMVVLGLMISNWEYSYTVPYCYIYKHFQAFYQNSTTVLTKETYWSIGYSIIFFIGGYLIMIRKAIK